MALLLTESDVRAVLPMPDLIDCMERALASHAAGQALQPVRTVLEVGVDRNYFGVMPASLSDPVAMGAKLVTVFHRNHDRGLPSHLAAIVLLDPGTGALEAIMDGRYITEARTAAVSAVSVKHLARADAATLAILGSGVQARSHLEAIRHVRPLREVRVWSRTPAHRERFATEAMRATGIPVRAAGTAADAVQQADIIVLATSSPTPVLTEADLPRGAHIAAVGACRPDQREMTAAVVSEARVFVDSRAAAMKEAGDILLAIRDGAIGDDHIAGELGDLPRGAVAGRSSPAQVTLFKSLGMAIEDVAAGRLVVDRARAQGLGQHWDPRS
jgi:ornithine cyclodeaminase